MAFIDNELKNTKYLVIEQDENWATLFRNSVVVSKNSTIKICPLQTIEIKGFQTNSYSNLDDVIKSKFDLF